MGRLLEVCVDSVESALAAKNGGAGRIELCGSLIIGGITPGTGLLRAVKRETSLPVNAMLRPRFGDFLYSAPEFETMLYDAQTLLDNGADALVFGALKENGELDIAKIKAIADMAHERGKAFTLHRAFDMCRDPFEALEICKELKLDTVLTSGQAASCLEGAETLKALFEKRGNVEILIGAGVNADVIRKIRKEIPQAESFHMSGKAELESKMLYRKPNISMGLKGISEYTLWRTDEESVRKAREALNDSVD